MKHQIKNHSFSKENHHLVKEYNQRHEVQLSEYIDKLAWWNEKINLVSRNVSRETLRAHVQHSLCICVIDEFNEANSILDTGTGGGLPGIPLAITSSEKSIDLNDIVGKKIITVNQMIRELGLKNTKGIAKSVGDLDLSVYDTIVTKHAFKINGLLELFADQPWESIIMLKGKSFSEELEGVEIPLNIEVFDLYKESHNPFYEGKAIVVVKKNEE